MEQRDNSFVLFRNKNKKHPNGPDWSGHAMVNGQAMFIDAWDKDAGKGQFLSGALKNKTAPKEEPPQRGIGDYRDPAGMEDDEIPFN